MTKTAGTGIPHFTGGEAISLTRKFHDSLLRTSLSQAESVPRLGRLMMAGLQASKVGIIWIDNAVGRDGREAFAKYLQRHGGTIVLDRISSIAGTCATSPTERLPKEFARSLSAFRGGQQHLGWVPFAVVQ